MIDQSSEVRKHAEVNLPRLLVFLQELDETLGLDRDVLDGLLLGDDLMQFVLADRHTGGTEVHQVVDADTLAYLVVLPTFLLFVRHLFLALFLRLSHFLLFLQYGRLVAGELQVEFVVMVGQ